MLDLSCKLQGMTKLHALYKEQLDRLQRALDDKVSVQLAALPVKRKSHLTAL